MNQAKDVITGARALQAYLFWAQGEEIREEVKLAQAAGEFNSVDVWRLKESLRGLPLLREKAVYWFNLKERKPRVLLWRAIVTGGIGLFLCLQIYTYLNAGSRGENKISSPPGHLL